MVVLALIIYGPEVVFIAGAIFWGSMACLYSAIGYGLVLVLLDTPLPYQLTKTPLYVLVFLLFFHVGSTAAYWIGGIFTAYLVFELWGLVEEHVGDLVNVGSYDFDHWAEQIMLCGDDKATDRLRVLGSRRAVDFVKHVPNMGLWSLLVPPDETRFYVRLEAKRCGAGEFEAAEAALREAGISGVSVERDRRGRPKRLIVECAMDYKKAATAAKLILFRVFGLTDDSVIRHYAFGYVDGPHYLGNGRYSRHGTVMGRWRPRKARKVSRRRRGNQ